MESDQQAGSSSNGNAGSNRASVKARASTRVAKSGSIASDAKSASETSKSVLSTLPPMSIKPYGKRLPALGLEKLQRLSQAGLLQRTAFTAAEDQGGSVAPTTSPSGKKLTSLQKLFATVSPRSSVYVEPPAASDAAAAPARVAEVLEPPKKHEAQELEEVDETTAPAQPTRRRSSLVLVSHDDGEFEMTTVVSVDDVEVETAENVEPQYEARGERHEGKARAAEEPPSAEKRSSYLQLLNRRSKYQQQQQRNRTCTDSTATVAVPTAGTAAANLRDGTRSTDQSPIKLARPTSRSRRAGSANRLRKDPADEAKQSLMRLNAKLKMLTQQREAQLQQEQQQQQQLREEPEGKEAEEQPQDGQVESAPRALQVETQPTSDAVSQSTALPTPSPSPHPAAPKFQLDQIQAVAAEVRKHATSQHAFRTAMRNPVFRILIATKLGSASSISQQFAGMTRSEQLKMLRDVRSMVDRFSAEGLAECLLKARQQLVDEELNRVKKMLYQKLETIKPRLASLTREELVTLAQQRITLGALLQQFERSTSSSQKYDSERHWAELLARQSLQREASIEARRRQLEEELKLAFWEERANATQAYEDKVEALLREIQGLRDSVVSLHARIHKQTEESAFTMAAELGIDAHRLGETGAQRYLELYRHVARGLRRLDPRVRTEALSTN